MKKLRVYVDTSLVGGYFDIEFEEWSKALINDFRAGRYQAVVSNVVAKEIAAVRDFVRELYAEIALASGNPLMTQNRAFHSVHFFRSVRDKHADLLSDRGPDEIVAFFLSQGEPNDSATSGHGLAGPCYRANQPAHGEAR